MAKIDDTAAAKEVEKAEDCFTKADELISIAKTLREEAQEHLRQAHHLSPDASQPADSRR
jgi:hypothetical protein